MTDRHARKPIRFAIDTSVLLCFLNINRSDLLKRHPATFLATREVADEVLRKAQRARYKRAISRHHVLKNDGHMTEEEMAIFRHLTTEKNQGPGESSAIAIAIIRKNLGLALEDSDAIKHANRLAHERNKIVSILRVRHIFADLVRRGAVSISEVEALLEDLAKHHRFHLKIDSVREVL